MALTRSIEPLLWLDCEMTGLDPAHDSILSISVLITTSTLVPLDPTGLTLYIHHTPAQLAHMSPWCVSTHTTSGLVAIVTDPSRSTTAQIASQQILAYIRHYIPTSRTALLAGNSIHADKMFLMLAPWNVILEHLHYRLFDVSAMKEMVRRWAPESVLRRVPVKKLTHQAREDVLESIDEARFYMGLLQSLNGAFGGNSDIEHPKAREESLAVDQQSIATSNELSSQTDHAASQPRHAQPEDQSQVQFPTTDPATRTRGNVQPQDSLSPQPQSQPPPQLEPPTSTHQSPFHSPRILANGSTSADTSTAFFGQHGDMDVEAERERFRTDVP